MHSREPEFLPRGDRAEFQSFIDPVPGNIFTLKILFFISENPMDIKIEDINATRKAATVTVPAAVIEEQQKKLLGDYAAHARIAGFRPGKAPVSVVRQKFGKELQKELVQRVTQEAYKAVRGDENLNVYALVDVKEPTLADGQPAELRFEIDVVPAFELPEYKGIEVSKSDLAVSDEEVAETVRNLRSQRAEFNKVEKAAEKGDYVKLSYEATIDGKPLAEVVPAAALYGKQTGTWEEAGAEETFGATVREIVDALVGLKAGDKKEITVAFPEDFSAEGLRGKTAVYAVDVAEVRERVLPELNEEFFKSLHVKDAEELNKQVREGLETRKKNAATSKKREELINKLNEKVDFELPESALERESYNIFVEFANMQLRQGVKIAEIEAQRDELMKNTKEAAKTRVKTQLILDAIAKKEGVKVEQNDISARIAQEAYMNGQPVEKFVKELTKEQTRLMELQRNILFNKALDVVVAASVEKE